MNTRFRSSPPSPPVPAGQSLRVASICAILFLVVLALFGRTIGFEFVNLDDDQNVTNNPVIYRGFSWDGIRTVFSLHHSATDYWHPLTFVTHMFDCEFFGLWAGGHHLTNVLIHGGVTVLLFLVLRSMTGALWRSAFVSALFAIHPLRVESVAWVTERKDVLSGFFFILMIGAYLRYGRRPFSMANYLLVTALFACGLMSKPTVMAAPVFLLALDYWPLCRLEVDPARRFLVFLRLITEKLPLCLLSLAFAVEACIGNRSAFEAGENIPFSLRIGNAFTSYVIYLRDMAWPSGLAPFCTFPAEGIPMWQLLGSLLILISVSIVVFLQRKSRPIMMVGWLWYLILILPTIGFIQGGIVARADRYTYLPMIGILMMVTWLAGDITRFWNWSRPLKFVLGLTLLMLYARVSWVQLPHWRTPLALWTHTLRFRGNFDAVYVWHGNTLWDLGRIPESRGDYEKALMLNPHCADALVGLASILVLEGRQEEAIGMFWQAGRISPGESRIPLAIGNALLELGRNSEAEEAYRESVKLRPDDAAAHYNLGNALFIEGRNDEAIMEYREALRFNPSHRKAHHTLADAMLKSGRPREALLEYREGLRVNPTDAGAWHNLGKLLYQQGSRAEGIQDLKESLRLEPGKVEALNDLAWMLSTAPEANLRDGKRALELALQADKSSGGNDPATLDTLAAAYAENGDYLKALEQARKALALAKQQGNKELASSLKEEIALYEAGKPCRDPQ